MPEPDRPPVPDPTTLTTDQLLRAVEAERDYVDGQVAILEQRLSAIDKATKLLNETVNRTPTDIQKEVTHLRELQDERFGSVESQFKERDTRAERESRDNKVAVDAAFAAQKEAAAKQDETNLKAIDKSESATKETIDKLDGLFKTRTEALSDKIDDLKNRLTTVEQQKVGRTEAVNNHERKDDKDMRFQLAIGGFVITVVVAIIVIVANVLTSATP